MSVIVSCNQIGSLLGESMRCIVRTFKRMTMLRFIATLTLLLSNISSPEGSAVIDICEMTEIKSVLERDKIVTVRTPSGSEEGCKPTFTIPANYALDVSIVSGRVPKRSFGGPEHHCVKVRVRRD